MMRTYYIYLLRNPNNDEAFYVGVTQKPSQRLSCHSASRRAPAMNAKDKYIADNNINPVMEIIDKVEVFWKDKAANYPQEVLDLEKEWITKLKSKGFPLTNRSIGNRTIPTYSIGDKIIP